MGITMEQLSTNEILYVVVFVSLLVISWLFPVVVYFFDRREKPFTNVGQAKGYYFCALLGSAIWPLLLMLCTVVGIMATLDWIFGKIVKVVLAKIIDN